MFSVCIAYSMTEKITKDRKSAHSSLLALYTKRFKRLVPCLFLNYCLWNFVTFPSIFASRNICFTIGCNLFFPSGEAQYHAWPSSSGCKWQQLQIELIRRWWHLRQVNITCDTCKMDVTILPFLLSAPPPPP